MSGNEVPQRRDNSLGEGVFYAPPDYAGFIQRLVVIGVDLLLLLVILWVMWLPFQTHPNAYFWTTFATISWIYLTLIKSSKLGTVGYRLTGLKIVNLRGERPSVIRMTFRLLLWLFGPFNVLFDLVWQWADTERQTLRDCLSGTYVVRANAEPVGSGSLYLARYSALGLALSYPRVRKPAV